MTLREGYRILEHAQNYLAAQYAADPTADNLAACELATRLCIDFYSL